jgi:hypothetical protein
MKPRGSCSNAPSVTRQRPFSERRARLLSRPPIWGIALLTLVLAGTPEAEDLLARSAVTAFYSANDGHLVAVIRADRIFVDHQQMGFFRIGVLPFVAAVKGADLTNDMFCWAKARSFLISASPSLRPIPSP